VYDYRVAAEAGEADAASGVESSWMMAPQPSIWRRDMPAVDGSATTTSDPIANGVATHAAVPGQPDADDDAGLGIVPDNPPRTLPEPSAALGQAGWAALNDWAALPTFADSSARLFSTHERSAVETPLIDPGNKDFNSFLAVCGDHPALVAQQTDSSVSCGPGQSGYLVAADDGPGYVSRILLARGISNPSSSVLVDLRPLQERIRIYIDGAQMPVFDGLWSDWASAQPAPFNAPLTGWSSGGTISYLPISYSHQLRVFVDGLTGSSSLTLYYVQVNTHRVKATRPFDLAELAAPGARAQLDALLATSSSAGATWLDRDVALQGAGVWSVWSRDQPGTLQRLELQLDPASASEVMNETVLRVSWDDTTPAIELPLALLFGARHTLAPFSTLPLSVQVTASAVQLKLSLPMPFAHSARIELVHATDSVRSVRVRLYGSDELPRADWGRLHSSFSELRDPQAGDRFRVAALSGRGKYLGTLMYMRGKADTSRSVPADELGFLEGDERLEVDGQVTSLGTGTDNYFNGGFYFKDGLFNTPFAALSQLSTNQDDGTSEATMMRWTILSDDLHFQNQLDLSFELGADRPATVRDYSAVSFYYQ
jgi:hypothetical protein